MAKKGHGVQMSISAFLAKAAEKGVVLKSPAEALTESRSSSSSSVQRSPLASSKNDLHRSPRGLKEATPSPRKEGEGTSWHNIGVWDSYAQQKLGTFPDGTRKPPIGETYWAVYVVDRSPEEYDIYACCSGRILSHWGQDHEFQYDGRDAGDPVWVPRHWLFKHRNVAREVVRVLNAKLRQQEGQQSPSAAKERTNTTTTTRQRKRPRRRREIDESPPPKLQKSADKQDPAESEEVEDTTEGSSPLAESIPTHPISEEEHVKPEHPAELSSEQEAELLTPSNASCLMPTTPPAVSDVSFPETPPALEESPPHHLHHIAVVGLKLWFLSTKAMYPVLVGQPRVPDMAVQDFFHASVLGQTEEFEAMRPSPGQVLYVFRVDKDGGKRPITAKAARCTLLSATAGFILASYQIAGALWAEVAADGSLAAYSDLNHHPLLATSSAYVQQ